MLVPTGSVTGQLVAVVQVAEQWLAAAVAAHFSDHLACLVVVVPFLHPSPILRAAAAGIGGGWFPAGLTALSLVARCWLKRDTPERPEVSHDIRNALTI